MDSFLLKSILILPLIFILAISIFFSRTYLTFIIFVFIIIRPPLECAGRYANIGEATFDSIINAAFYLSMVISFVSQWLKEKIRGGPKIRFSSNALKISFLLFVMIAFASSVLTPADLETSIYGFLSISIAFFIFYYLTFKERMELNYEKYLSALLITCSLIATDVILSPIIFGKTMTTELVYDAQYGFYEKRFGLILDSFFEAGPIVFVGALSSITTLYLYKQGYMKLGSFLKMLVYVSIFICVIAMAFINSRSSIWGFLVFLIFIWLVPGLKNISWKVKSKRGLVIILVVLGFTTFLAAFFNIGGVLRLIDSFSVEFLTKQFYSTAVARRNTFWLIFSKVIPENYPWLGFGYTNITHRLYWIGTGDYGSTYASVMFTHGWLGFLSFFAFIGFLVRVAMRSNRIVRPYFLGTIAAYMMLAAGEVFWIAGFRGLYAFTWIAIVIRLSNRSFDEFKMIFRRLPNRGN